MSISEIEQNNSTSDSNRITAQGVSLLSHTMTLYMYIGGGGGMSLYVCHCVCVWGGGDLCFV